MHVQIKSTLNMDGRDSLQHSDDSSLALGDGRHVLDVVHGNAHSSRELSVVDHFNEASFICVGEDDGAAPEDEPPARRPQGPYARAHPHGHARDRLDALLSGWRLAAGGRGSCRRVRIRRRYLHGGGGS